LLAAHCRIKLKEIINRLGSFEEVDKTLNRNPRTPEAWSTANPFRADPNCFIQPVLLFRSHTLNLSYFQLSRHA
jgi:hypothetical protein